MQVNKPECLRGLGYGLNGNRRLIVPENCSDLWKSEGVWCDCCMEVCRFIPQRDEARR